MSTITQTFSFDDSRRAKNASLNQTASQKPATTGEKQQGEGFSFLDFLDIINPLQHIPVVSSVYRAVTGDEISPPARIIGGTLYGGPLGAAGSIANVIIEEQTGKDIGENMMAMVKPAQQERGQNPVAQVAAVEREILFPADGETSQNYAKYRTEFHQTVPQEQVPERMMRALDQYRDMVQARQQSRGTTHSAGGIRIADAS